MKQEMVIVSNRLPLSFEKGPEGVHAKASSGGLVTALEPLLKKQGGIWVGAAGTEQDPKVQEQIHEELAKLSREHSYRYESIFMTPEENAKYYEGFSNEIIWPLFHDLQSRCNFDPTYWDFYLRINERFANSTLQHAKRNALIWINDYQLMQVAPMIRRRAPKLQLAFFLHIPFPPPDIFEKLPWRNEVLEGLLAHNVVGFQTERDMKNFLACVRKFLGGASIVRRPGEQRVVRHRDWETHVGAYPISIDFEDFEKASDADEVRRRTSALRARLTSEVAMVLGIDRLDYTKGILERLKAFALFLRQNPALHQRTSLVQIVVPSRETIPGYQNLKSEIERLVTQINGEFADPNWTPIKYIHRSLPRTELLALYRTARVAFITPLKDGMNLVAKEYIACRHEDDGVLILSEFAGAAAELKNDPLLVNPYDQQAVANALALAVTMTEAEQHRRMTRMRAQVRKANLSVWLQSFLSGVGDAASA